MKTIAILAAVCAAGWAQDPWKVGGRIGVRQSGSKMVPTAAVTAEYQLGDQLTWRTDLEAQLRDLSNPGEYALQVPTHMLWHPLGTKRVFDPYAGPGASFGMDFAKNAMFGCNGVIGFTIHPSQQQAFGIEWRWSWPDLTRNLNGRWDAGLTGNWEVKF